MPRFHPYRIFRKYKRLREELGEAALNSELEDIVSNSGVARKVAVWLFETFASFPISFFADTDTPATSLVADFDGVNLGLKFQSSEDGFILGVRFYKGGTANAGPHFGSLWEEDGTNLDTVEFETETDSGWQEQLFDTPIPIEADTTYVVSYYAPEGSYSHTGSFYTNRVLKSPLIALSNNESGGNCVFDYAATSEFPTSSGNSSCYWVDVIFVDEL
jgi:uncharacterized protein DUF4082